MERKFSLREDEVPGINLSFEWVKDVLNEQIRSVDSLDNKLVALFSVATVVFGLGLSLVVDNPRFSLSLLISSTWGVVALLSYSLAAILSSIAIWARYYERLRNPIKVRESYWDMTPLEFKVNILTHLEDAYASNQKKLLLKGWILRCLVPLLAIEVFSLVLLLFSLLARF